MKPGLKSIKPTHIYGLITVLALAFAVYSHYSNTARRVPVFAVDPLVTTIFSPETTSKYGFTLQDSDGETIDEFVYSQTGYFWNDGELATKPEHILRPFILHLSEGTIIDVRVTSASRNVVEPTLMLDDEGKSAEIGFEILEGNDGFSVQVIYSGPRNALLSMEGVVEGAPTIRDRGYSVGGQILTYFATSILAIPLAIGVGILGFRFILFPILDVLFDKFVKVLGVPSLENPMSKEELAAKDRNLKQFVRRFFWIAIVVILIALGIASTLTVLQADRSLLLDHVPEAIRGN